MKEEKITIEFIKELAVAVSTDLEKMIFIGGTAMLLYHYMAKRTAPLYTSDIDTLITPICDVRGKIEGLGFEEVPSINRNSRIDTTW